MNRYQPATSRSIAGLAAAFMTIATLAVSVLVPASMDSTTRDVIVATSNAPEQSTSTESGALTTSIDVVAFRKTKLVPVVSTRAQLRHDLAS